MIDPSVPDEVNFIKSFSDYGTISDSDTDDADSDSDSDSDSSYSDSSYSDSESDWSDSIDSDCGERHLNGLIEHFSTLNKPAGYRTRIVSRRGGKKLDRGIAKSKSPDDDVTDKTMPIESNHTTTSIRPAVSTDSEYEFESDEDCYEDDDDDSNKANHQRYLDYDCYDDDDGYDYDELLFRDNCEDDSSMSKFLRKLHTKSPVNIRVPSAAGGRTSPVSRYAREA